MAGTTPFLHQNNLLFTFPAKTSHSLFNYHNSLHPTKTLTSLSLSSFSLSPPSPPPCCRITRVSTAPLEYAPPSPEFEFHTEIARLKALRSKLSDSKTQTDKLSVIDSDSRVKAFFGSHKVRVSRVLEPVGLDDYELFLLKCVVAAGQEHVLGSISIEGEVESARGLLKGALHVLVDMIEKCDVNGSGEGLGSRVEEGVKSDEEIGALRKLLKTLREMEQFYDCIGGIIGLVFCFIG